MKDKEIRPTGGMPNLEWLLNKIPKKVQICLLAGFCAIGVVTILALIIKSIIN
jgi:hypothetical protein